MTPTAVTTSCSCLFQTPTRQPLRASNVSECSSQPSSLCVFATGHDPFEFTSSVDTEDKQNEQPEQLDADAHMHGVQPAAAPAQQQTQEQKHSATVHSCGGAMTPLEYNPPPLPCAAVEPARLVLDVYPQPVNPVDVVSSAPTTPGVSRAHR